MCLQNNMVITKSLSIVALLLICWACGPQLRVHSDYDPAYNVKNYTAFNWGPKINIEAGNNPLYYNELSDKRIKAAILQQLTQRGYRFDEGSSDLVVHYHIIIDDQTMIVTDPPGDEYGPYWLRMQTNLRQYQEGTLILDVMDSQSNSLIWRGWATAAIDPYYSPDDAEALTKKVVGKIFKKFPKGVINNDSVGFNQTTY